jgi:hypothetical protein
MKDDRDSQQRWQDANKRVYREQPACVIQEEWSGQVDIPSVYVHAGATVAKNAIRTVEVKPPILPVHSGANLSQRLKNFQQAHVIAPVSLNQRQGIVRQRRINRDHFLIGRVSCQAERATKGDCEKRR